MPYTELPGDRSIENRRISTLLMLGGYALSGFFMLTYVSYRGFITRAMSKKVTRPAG